MDQSQPAPQRRLPRTTLYREIFASTFIIPVVLVVAISLIGYIQFRSLTIDDAKSSLEAVAAVQEDRVASYTDSGIAGFSLIVSRPRMQVALDQFITTGDDNDLDDVGEVLLAALNSTPDADHISLHGTSGELLIYVGPEDDRVESPPALVKAASREIVVGTIVARQDGLPIHLIAGPVSIEGRASGIAVVGQSMDPLFDLVTESTGLGDTGETILAQDLDGDAQFIAPLRFDPDAALNRVELADRDRLPILSALDGQELSVDQGIDYRGEPVFSSTRYLEGPGWGLVVKKDVAEVLSPVESYALWVAGALLTAVLLAFLAARKVSNGITAPIKQLSANALAISRGRRDLEITSNLGEIEELAQALRTMVTEFDSLTRSLEDKIDERTWALSEKNIKLRQLMDDREVFLAGVSHELRSPLTAMIGFIDLVTMSSETIDDQERADMLETISAQADEVLNLIDDLLASARVEAGTLKVASVGVDLAAQARQVVEATQTSSRANVNFAGGSARAVGDPARVRQIVRNLISNALRYGGPQVQVAVVTRNGRAVLEVRDDGAGIPESDRVAVFEAFGQSEGTRKVAESVGLGLKVSRDLARLMGGDLTYDYRKTWSVFSLNLPVFTEDGTDDEATIPDTGSRVGSKQ